MDEAVAVADVMVVSSAQPFSFAFQYCLHLASRVSQWKRRLAYVSVAWSCCLIQFLVLWYLTVCCKRINSGISLVFLFINLYLVTSFVMHFQHVYMDLSGFWWTSQTILTP